MYIQSDRRQTFVFVVVDWPVRGKRAPHSTQCHRPVLPIARLLADRENPGQYIIVADFGVVDMFANYCTGREDVKTAMASAERSAKRIFR